MMIPQDVANTIVDPKAYADGRRVDEAFTWLRREAPLAQAQPEGFDPFWVVTRFADIQEVEKQIRAQIALVKSSIRAQYDAARAREIAAGAEASEMEVDSLNLVPEKYRGLDRFEARKLVVADINAAGLAVTVLVVNNRSYRILKQRLYNTQGIAAQTDQYVGMELVNPAIDYCGLARSLGVEACTARHWTK